MTLNDLTVSFVHLDRTVLLGDWRWLIGPRRQPILVTALGDAFLEDPEDGSVHLLSCGPGEVAPICAGIDEFRHLLTAREFVIEHFAPQVISELRTNGMTLIQGQLYGYKVPPHLGGEYSLANLEPTDIEVHFSLLGQMHQQARHPVPGTPISGVTLK
jgi:T6SS immunity protein Tdi1, C-terminal